ncbi:unnamed protein product [Ectocarpus fasciculatus]
MAQFDPKQFDPKLIVCQIVALQSFYYVAMGVFLGSFRAVFGTQVGTRLIFSGELVSLSTTAGWTAICCQVLTAISGALLLPMIVERAKKCLDFTSTLYIIHVAICSFYDGIPHNWEWWILQMASLALMVVLGEYACSRRELRDIPLFSPLPTQV